MAGGMNRALALMSALFAAIPASASNRGIGTVDPMTSRGKPTKKRKGKNVSGAHSHRTTNWKKILGVHTCGKRQQERMTRQRAAGWHKEHPMAVKLAAERTV